MDSPRPLVRSLILLGGQSSRMGAPKHLLPMPSEISETGEEAPLLIHSLYLHHIFLVKHGDPLLRIVTLSVRDEAQRDQIKGLLSQHERDLPSDLGINYIQDSSADAGPAAGLVAASRLDGHAHWLVTGCSHPLVTKITLEELWERHRNGRKAATCFAGSESSHEPLLAIWTPAALAFLSKELEKNDSVDLLFVLRQLEGQENSQHGNTQTYSQGLLTIHPTQERWTTSTNTKEDWKKVEDLFNQDFASNDPHG